MVRFKLRNKFVGWDGVKRAVLEVNPPPAGTIGPTQFSGVTDNGGSVRLDLRTLADGEHTVRITPKHWSIDPVGPATAGGSNPPDRIYRPLQFRITTAQGQVVSTQPPARPEWGSAERVNGREVRVKLQPVYVQANSHSPRAGDVTMIVMRRTSGDWIGSAINHFVSTSNNSSARAITPAPTTSWTWTARS